MKTIMLRTEYPCCHRKARFARIVGTPRQRYARTCADCGVTWDVIAVEVSDVDGVRIDRIEWEAMREE